MTLILFIIMLGGLIAIHEAGHMLVAKACGMYVREYAIGFGPKLWSKQGKETLYTLRAIPLGGFTGLIESENDNIDRITVVDKFAEITGLDKVLVAKILNNAAFDLNYAIELFRNKNIIFTDEILQQIEDLKNEMNASVFVEEKRTFYGAHPLKRIAVLAAGPFFNLIMAFIIFISIFVSIGTENVYPEAVIGTILPNSAAVEAGLQPNDKIIAIEYAGGDKVVIETIEDVTIQQSLHAGQALTLTIVRGEETIEISLQPRFDSETNEYLIGVMFAGDVTQKELTLGESILKGITYTINYIGLSFKSIIMLFTGKVGIESMSGTIGIYNYTAEAVSYGFISYLSLCGSLSISLALMNLIPIPVFDGGRILMTSVELITGKRLNKNLETILLSIGMVLIFLLFVVITFFDITKLFK